MIKMQIFAFLLRWLASSIGMYLCITWFGHVDSATVNSTLSSDSWWILYAAAGLIFSLINSVVKPIIKVLTLPLAILSLGVSTFIINAIMVVITIHLLPGVEMGFWAAAVSSIILGVINTTLNFLIS